MLKYNAENKVKIEGCDLIISFSGTGHSTKLGTELFLVKNKFVNIGYLYSENLVPVITYEQDGKIRYNGSFYYHADKNLCLLDITSGVKKSGKNKFNDELTNFIKNSKFKNIYLFGSSGKEDSKDIDLVGKEINFYYLSNDESLKVNANIKPIKDAFVIKEDVRKGRIYYEMSKVSGNDFLLKFVQKLILDKVKFIFIFSFNDELFDPFASLALFKKLNKIFDFSQEDEIVSKQEFDFLKIIDLIEEKTGIKLDNWKTLLTLKEDI